MEVTEICWRVPSSIRGLLALSEVPSLSRGCLALGGVSEMLRGEHLRPVNVMHRALMRADGFPGILGSKTSLLHLVNHGLHVIRVRQLDRGGIIFGPVEANIDDVALDDGEEHATVDKDAAARRQWLECSQQLVQSVVANLRCSLGHLEEFLSGALLPQRLSRSVEESPCVSHLLVRLFKLPLAGVVVVDDLGVWTPQLDHDGGRRLALGAVLEAIGAVRGEIPLQDSNQAQLRTLQDVSKHESYGLESSYVGFAIVIRQGGGRGEY